MLVSNIASASEGQEERPRPPRTPARGPRPWDESQTDPRRGQNSVTNRGLAYPDASASLGKGEKCRRALQAARQAEKEEVLAAVANNGLVLQYAGAPLQADKEVVLVAVANKGLALQYAAAPLTADKEVVLAAVANNGLALQYAAAPLKADKEVVFTAVAQSDTNEVTVRRSALEARAKHSIVKDILLSASAPLRDMVVEGARRCGCTCQAFAISELKEPTACVRAWLHLKQSRGALMMLHDFVIDASARILPDAIPNYGEEAVLQGVDLGANPSMSCESLGSIVESLLGYKIQALNLSFNPQLGDGMIAAIQPLLEAKKSPLTDLKLADCGLTVVGLKMFVQVARKARLHLLDISYIKVRGESELIEQVLELPMVEQLAFRSCDLSPEEVRTIAEGLPFTCVKSLDLAGNAFGSEGLVHLAGKLSESMVVELDLSGIGIEAKCEGLYQLAKAWIERPFPNLSLKNNPMGHAEMVHFITTLRTLRLVNGDCNEIISSTWSFNNISRCC